MAILAFFLFLGWDIVKILHLNELALTSLGEHWFYFHKSSIIIIQSIIQRYLHYVLWDPIIISIIKAPASIFFLILYIIFYFFESKQKKNKRWFK